MYSGASQISTFALSYCFGYFVSTLESRSQFFDYDSFCICILEMFLIFCSATKILRRVNNAITKISVSLELWESCTWSVVGCCPEITLFSNRVSFACRSGNTVTDTPVRCGLYRLHQYYIVLAVVAPKPSSDKRFVVDVSSIIQLSVCTPRPSMFSSISV